MSYHSKLILLHYHKDSFDSTTIHKYNYNVEHDIITRDANSVSWAEIWEISKSQCDTIDAVTI